MESWPRRRPWVKESLACVRMEEGCDGREKYEDWGWVMVVLEDMVRVCL